MTTVRALCAFSVRGALRMASNRFKDRQDDDESENFWWRLLGRQTMMMVAAERQANLPPLDTASACDISQQLGEALFYSSCESCLVFIFF